MFMIIITLYFSFHETYTPKQNESGHFSTTTFFHPPLPSPPPSNAVNRQMNVSMPSCRPTLGRAGDQMVLQICLGVQMLEITIIFLTDWYFYLPVHRLLSVWCDDNSRLRDIPITDLDRRHFVPFTSCHRRSHSSSWSY